MMVFWALESSKHPIVSAAVQQACIAHPVYWPRKALRVNDPRQVYPDPMEIDQKLFREALGQFATGITVITTLDQSNQPLGFTANSFNSVSLDPPLVLWSLAKTASTYHEFIGAEKFGIHILAEDQTDLSNRFASTADNRFQNLEYQLTNGIPLLTGCLARFQCGLENIYEGGDHSIFVARVLELDMNSELDALVYHRGSYTGLKR